MESKHFTQYGKLMFYIFVPIIIISLLKFYTHYHLGNTDFTPIILMTFILSLVLLLVYRLTITISEQFVSFKMGIGIINKKYTISDLKSVKVVKNNWMYGWGIRFIPGGWLYNVSGFKAIELRFHSSDKIIRIGTDKPEEVTSEIEKLIKV
ncbi:MAG: hypothetical protein ACK48V_04150 [Crocinitomicaceae bacterium]|jgi:hypothetical protein